MTAEMLRMAIETIVGPFERLKVLAVENAIEAAILEEREACAKIADAWPHNHHDLDKAAAGVAAEIRKRGQS